MLRVIAYTTGRAIPHEEIYADFVSFDVKADTITIMRGETSTVIDPIYCVRNRIDQIIIQEN